MTRSKSLRSHVVLELAKKGPDLTITFLDRGGATREQAQLILDQFMASYRTWAGCWVVPELEDLLPLPKK